MIIFLILNIVVPFNMDINFIITSIELLATCSALSSQVFVAV
jgi:hypothetical protein